MHKGVFNMDYVIINNCNIRNSVMVYSAQTTANGAKKSKSKYKKLYKFLMSLFSDI